MEFEFALILFLGAVIASRIISQRALRELSADQKATLLDAFSGFQAYGLIPLVVLLVVYFFLASVTAMSSAVLTVGYFSALVAYVAWNFFFTRRRLKKLDLPESYLSKLGIARVIQYVGIGFFLAVVVTSGF